MPENPHGVLGLFSADAFIKDQTVFAEQARAAFEFAGRQASLLTMAIKPTHPATGFGYLELGAELGRTSERSVFRKVERFVEKPALAKAEEYVASGRFAWNAGMFVWQTAVFLAEAEKNAPELATFIKGFPKGDYAEYLARTFPVLPKISVDYAIMEKAASVVTVVASFDWDDVGLWTALPKHLASDASGNATRGPVFAVDSSNNIAVSNGRTIALCGVKDLVVVETPDAILVCHQDAVQDIKKLQPLLPKEVL